MYIVYHIVCYHIDLVFEFLDSLSCLADLLLVSSGWHVEIVQREGPEGGVEFGRHVFPHFGRVELPCSFDYGIQD